MNQKTVVVFLVVVINMSSLVAGKTEGICSEAIRTYLVNQNVTDENLIQKIQEVEKIKAEFDRLSPPDKLTFISSDPMTGQSRIMDPIPLEEADAVVQKLLQQREECVANKTRLAEFKERQSEELQRKLQTMQQQIQKMTRQQHMTRQQQMQYMEPYIQEQREYESNHRQYHHSLRILPLIDKKVMIIQSAFQQLLNIKRRRLEIMEKYPTNEFDDLLSYLRFRQISKMRRKMSREWAELAEREKNIQEKMEKHQTEQAEILKTKQEEMEKKEKQKEKQKEIELLQQQIDKLKSGV